MHPSSQVQSHALRLHAGHRITSLGMNIVTVVHQPRYSVFCQFHEVLLLGQGGRTVYLGPTETALRYFSSLGFELPPHENPADFFLDVISGTIPCRTDPDFRPKVGLLTLPWDIWRL